MIFSEVKFPFCGGMILKLYSTDPYGDYYTNSELLFPISNQDDRLGLKETIVGLEDDGLYKAYKLHDVEDKKVINDGSCSSSISIS